MELLRDAFNVKVGFSDHTLGVGSSIAAISLGASVIEKHITLSRNDGGADGAFSMEPQEFATLVMEGNAAAASLGTRKWEIQASEMESRRLRRSLYIVEDVRKGVSVTAENIRAIRPGQGISGAHFRELIGKKFNQDLKRGTPMSLDYIE
jgi:N-acetylneuraminate synthase